jgi:hypothetical protein
VVELQEIIITHVISVNSLLHWYRMRVTVVDSSIQESGLSTREISAANIEIHIADSLGYLAAVDVHHLRLGTETVYRAFYEA